MPLLPATSPSQFPEPGDAEIDETDDSNDNEPEVCKQHHRFRNTWMLSLWLIRMPGAFSLPEHLHRPTRQAKIGCPDRLENFLVNLMHAQTGLTNTEAWELVWLHKELHAMGKAIVQYPQDSMKRTLPGTMGIRASHIQSWPPSGQQASERCVVTFMWCIMEQFGQSINIRWW